MHLLNVNTTVFEAFRLDLLGNLNTRMQPYIQRKEYIIASILDPRLKSSLFQLKWDVTKELKLDIPNREVAVGYVIDAYDQEMSLAITDDSRRRKGSHNPRQREFLEALELDKNQDKSEIDFYLEELASDQSACPLEYWKINCKRFPVLGRIARKFLAIPATSAGVERIFSVSGAIARARRSKISTKKIAELLMLLFILVRLGRYLVPKKFGSGC
ncbi:Zinc finger BED domain-containing protein 4 [Orchesella cincta]|uniref:Zinc finger BED domain-containing protein 4 n=1 Tax=Orchesella cincta TaxID=48709 RepID=A0A1D2M0Q1_ORCCI|nr:Zinc finger BED domain-containing protein 4 [Orchesella cincta]